MMGIANCPQQVAEDFAVHRHLCDNNAGTAGGGVDNSSGANYSKHTYTTGGRKKSGVGIEDAATPCMLSAAEVVGSAGASWEALFQQHGVDFFIAGHYHEYESLWPSLNGLPTQFNFTDPKGTIHMTAGNGGAC
jgi:hypothetical protein